VIDQILFLLLVGSEKPCICGFPNLYGPYVDTVGRNKKAIKAYIANQLQENQIADQISLKEFVDPFTGSKNTKA
jgi:hypothetical protein